MEFVAGNYLLTIEANMVSITNDPGPRRTSNIFYIVLFLWFGYLFAKRILKVQTSPAFNWFMVLLFGALAIYYFILLVIRLVRKKREENYSVENIKEAGVVEKEGNFYVAWQMENKKFVTINFLQDEQTAQSFISKLLELNPIIEVLKK